MSGGATSTFDRYVMVDWSAAARPVTGANSIWIAVHDGRELVGLHNPPTRARAWDLIDDLCHPGDATLLGIDASFGLPAGAAQLLGDSGDAPWLRMWELIAATLEDRDDNRNNRFEAAGRLNRVLTGGPAPFWGCPARAAGDYLRTTRPNFPVAVDGLELAEYRACESALRHQGLQPQPTWKLAYQASVGSQFLTLVPALLARRSSGFRIWPFDTGFSLPAGPGVIVAEIWPGAFPLRSEVHDIRDAAQVIGTVMAVVAAADAGELDSWATGPEDPQVRHLALTEEGWLLSPARANGG